VGNVEIASLLLHRQEELAASLGTARDVIGHPSVKGNATEGEWRTTLAGFLPSRYKVESATVVDCDGNLSDHIDVVIFDEHHSPTLFRKKDALYVTAESVYGVFEIKQDLSKQHVQYAMKKASSVRRLKRTSAPMVCAGVTFEERGLFPIVAGILTTSSDWKAPFGQPLQHALSTVKTDEQLQLGCCLAHGAFDASYDERGVPTLEVGSSEASLMFLLLRLFGHLAQKGTVPAIDLRAYGRDLSAT
jgi:hypothetical protein